MKVVPQNFCSLCNIFSNTLLSILARDVTIIPRAIDQKNTARGHNTEPINHGSCALT